MRKTNLRVLQVGAAERDLHEKMRVHLQQETSHL